MIYTKLSKDEQLLYLYIYSMGLESEDASIAYSLDDIVKGMMLLCDIWYMDILENLTTLTDKEMLISEIIDDMIHYRAARPSIESHIQDGCCAYNYVGI